MNREILGFIGFPYSWPLEWAKMVNVAFHPPEADDPLLYSGGRCKSWALACNLSCSDQMLVIGLGCRLPVSRDDHWHVIPAAKIT